MSEDLVFPAYDPRDREVIAFAEMESYDFAADEFVDLRIAATQTAGNGPVIEIGRYEIALDEVPKLVRAINRMAGYFEQVSAR